MAEEIGSARERWGWDVWRQAEDFANNMKSEDRPFYIVYAAKQDKLKSKEMGRGVYRQTYKAYYEAPPKILGILVWYVDNRKGVFEFKPDLSSPFDVPLDPSLLSEKASDALPTVMEKGKKLGVLLA
jgi:hypothetical protein